MKLTRGTLEPTAQGGYSYAATASYSGLQAINVENFPQHIEIVLGRAWEGYGDLHEDDVITLTKIPAIDPIETPHIKFSEDGTDQPNPIYNRIILSMTGRYEQEVTAQCSPTPFVQEFAAIQHIWRSVAAGVVRPSFPDVFEGLEDVLSPTTYFTAIINPLHAEFTDTFQHTYTVPVDKIFYPWETLRYAFMQLWNNNPYYGSGWDNVIKSMAPSAGIHATEMNCLGIYRTGVIPESNVVAEITIPVDTRTRKITEIDVSYSDEPIGGNGKLTIIVGSNIVWTIEIKKKGLTHLPLASPIPIAAGEIAIVKLLPGGTDVKGMLNVMVRG